MENTFKFRCGEDTLKKLDIVARELSISKAEVIRRGIELQYERTNKENVE